LHCPINLIAWKSFFETCKVLKEKDWNKSRAVFAIGDAIAFQLNKKAGNSFRNLPATFKKLIGLFF